MLTRSEAWGWGVPACSLEWSGGGTWYTAETYGWSEHRWAPMLRPIAVSQMMSRAQWVTWVGSRVGRGSHQGEDVKLQAVGEGEQDVVTQDPALVIDHLHGQGVVRANNKCHP